MILYWLLAYAPLLASGWLVGLASTSSTTMLPSIVDIASYLDLV